MSDRRFSGDFDRLRDPASVKMMGMDSIIAAALDGIQPQSMLDIGTGTAVFAEHFNKAGIKTVAGLDVNPEMLEAAKQYLPNAEFKVGPAELLPWDDNSFDLVFMGFVFHEVDDYVKTLQEAARVGTKRIAILEFPKIEQPFGPPLNHRLEAQQVIDFAHNAGLKETKIVELEHLVLYLWDL